MLTAKKSIWFETIFAIYCRNLFKRRFHSLKVSGLEYISKKKDEIPMVIYCNHSSWWDGLVAFQISSATNLDSYIMMEEKQLKKLFLFRKLGAFSVIRENTRDAVKSINYAVSLLKEKQNRSLWIFPQGEILANDCRPIEFYNGVSNIIEKIEECQSVSLAIRYEFLGNFKPEIFVKINKPEVIKVGRHFNRKETTERFELNIEQTLNELKNDVLFKKIADYKPLI